MRMARQLDFGRWLIVGAMIFFVLTSDVIYAGEEAFIDEREFNLELDRVDTQSAGIVGNVEIEGVAIINNKVYIDGVPIKKGTHEAVSRKSGKKYKIDWGDNSNVKVTEK